MGMFDNIREQAEKVIADNPDKVESISDQVIEKAGDVADERTGGKFSDKIDSAQQTADERIGE